jgi:hypothetical protein
MLINKPDFPLEGNFTHEIRVETAIVCINKINQQNSDDNIMLDFNEWEEIKKFIDNEIKKY